MRLYNVTSSSTLAVSTNAYSGTGSNSFSPAVLAGSFTLTSTAQVRLDYYAGAAVVNGLSVAGTNGDATNQTVGVLEFYRLASTVKNACKVISAVTQSLLSSGTKMVLGNVQFNDGTPWDTTNNWFKPIRAGYYHVIAHITAASTYTGTLVAVIRKNGTDTVGRSAITVTSASPSTEVNDIVYLNGTTDYLEFLAYSSTSTLTYDINTYATYFSAMAQST